MSETDARAALRMLQGGDGGKQADAGQPSQGHQTVEGEVPDGARLLPSPNAPLDVARQLIDERFRHPSGALTLRYWQGQWWQWHTTCWAEAERVAIERAVYQFTHGAFYLSDKPELKPWHPTNRKVTDVLRAAATVAYLERATEQPCWLDGSTRTASSGVIVSVANGLLDVAERRLLPHTPQYFNVVSVPFDFDIEAREPERWLSFLESIWLDDDDQIALLRQWMGYVVSGRTDLHKIHLMVGPPRSGKGTIGRILSRLIGIKNVAGPTLSSLRGEFGLQPLIGIPLAIIGDARLESARGAVVEQLLSISGEDPKTVNIKFCEQWTGRLPTRFMLLSNEVPHFADASGTIATRFLPQRLKQSFLGKEDKTIESDIIANELPGVLNWTLEGLAQLEAQGRFTWPAEAEAMVTRLANLASPVRAFVRDRCVLDPERTVDVKDLWAAWRTWAEENSESRKTKQVFGRDLHAACPDVESRQHRGGERFYQGIGLAGLAEEPASSEEEVPF